MTIPPLGGGRGCPIRADSIEDLSCGPLDIFEAFVEEIRITAVQTDVVLIMLCPT